MDNLKFLGRVPPFAKFFFDVPMEAFLIVAKAENRIDKISTGHTCFYKLNSENKSIFKIQSRNMTKNKPFCKFLQNISLDNKVVHKKKTQK